MSQLIALVRGLVHRAGSAAMILVVAVVAAGLSAPTSSSALQLPGHWPWSRDY